jgi:hypothetical protein
MFSSLLVLPSMAIVLESPTASLCGLSNCFINLGLIPSKYRKMVTQITVVRRGVLAATDKPVLHRGQAG